LKDHPLINIIINSLIRKIAIVTGPMQHAGKAYNAALFTFLENFVGLEVLLSVTGGL